MTEQVIASPTETPPKIQLVITLHPNGSVDVSGPFDNKILMYGLLGIANAMVSGEYQKREASKIQPVPSGVDGLLRRMNGDGTRPPVKEIIRMPTNTKSYQPEKGRKLFRQDAKKGRDLGDKSSSRSKSSGAKRFSNPLQVAKNW